jgi:ABC-type spermidine/putrescine transport system permease subunit II
VRKVVAGLAIGGVVAAWVLARRRPRGLRLSRGLAAAQLVVRGGLR